MRGDVALIKNGLSTPLGNDNLADSSHVFDKETCSLGMDRYHWLGTKFLDYPKKVRSSNIPIGVRAFSC